MTLRYKLLGIPGNLNEFLDREKKKYNSIDIRIMIQLKEQEYIAVENTFSLIVYLYSADKKRKIKLNQYDNIESFEKPSKLSKKDFERGRNVGYSKSSIKTLEKIVDFQENVMQNDSEINKVKKLISEKEFNLLN